MMSGDRETVEGLPRAAPPASADAVITLRNVTVSYDRKPAVRSVSVDIPAAERIAIVGPNGAGKSTVIKAIIGLVALDSGQIRVHGEPISKVRQRVAYVPQRGAVDWDFPVRVKDVVLMGRFGRIGWFRWPSRADHEIVANALERMGMTPFADRQIGQLSGGQQQRVFLARALAQEADILLLDEPFVGVDANTEEAIFALLEAARAEGKTAVVVNHDLGAVRRHFDRVLLLNGRVVAYGPPDEVMRPDILQRTYGGRLNVLDAADGMMVI
ncbi:manganese ABC transporter ATP-binding protein MntB [soil metagenome]